MSFINQIKFMESLLPKVSFGNTDLKVTKICVGGAPLGGMRYGDYRVPETQAIETLIHIFNSPIRFLDTASLYDESELRIGDAIKEFGGLPQDFVIATKADRDPNTGDFSAEQIKRSVEKSLKLLGVGRLPIVYLHDPEHSSFTFEQIMSVQGPVVQLHKLKEEGLIKHIGISGGPIDMLINYVNTQAFEAVITHNRYTLLNRLAEPLIDKASQLGLAVVNAAIYNMGILAKGLEDYPYYYNQGVNEDVADKVKGLEYLSSKYHVPIAAVALQFSLRDPRITSTVIGMSNPKEVDQNLELAEVKIPEEVWVELANVSTVTKDPAE